jgi:hypothetical protein
MNSDSVKSNIDVYIGELCFKDNNEAFISHENKEYTIWNNYDVSQHTFGYPQMNATINGIYTCYRAGCKIEFWHVSDGSVYLEKVISR